MIKITNIYILNRVTSDMEVGYILITPVVALMVLGFANNLVEIAGDTQQKVTVFADDMNNAVDCATRGIPIEVCSPRLMEQDFSGEINNTIEINEEILEMLEESGQLT